MPISPEALQSATESVLRQMLLNSTAAPAPPAPAPAVVEKSVPAEFDYQKIIAGVTMNLMPLFKSLVVPAAPAAPDKPETTPPPVAPAPANADAVTAATLAVLKNLGVEASANGSEIIIKSNTVKSTVADQTNPGNPGTTDDADPDYQAFTRFKAQRNLDKSLMELSAEGRQEALGTYLKALL